MPTYEKAQATRYKAQERYSEQGSRTGQVGIFHPDRDRDNFQCTMINEVLHFSLKHIGRRLHIGST